MCLHWCTLLEACLQLALKFCAADINTMDFANDSPVCMQLALTPALLEAMLRAILLAAILSGELSGPVALLSALGQVGPQLDATCTLAWLLYLC